MPQAVPAQSPALTRPIRFGPSGRFELRPAELRLLVDGQPAALGSRAMDVLITLVSRPHELVTKNELLDLVWPGLVVEENNLQVQISGLRKLLGSDVIATVPGRGYRFSAALAANDATVVGTAGAGALAHGAAATAAMASSAPPAAPPLLSAPRLFGRDADLALLESLLGAGRCVTLLGPAGVGKSSLARAVMARRRGRSVWVDLAALAPGSPVAGAVARALGVQLEDGESVARLLRALQANPPANPQKDAASVDGAGGPPQPLLLVLDNTEHLIEPSAELVVALQALDGVQIVATSQIPLAVSGEHLLRLAPLVVTAVRREAGAASSASPGDGVDLAALGDGAVAMLVERIVAADHRFRVTPAALPLLASICEHLDGLPLALEMAAARVPVLGVKGVHDALTQRFALLTRGHRDAAVRHRTLHNALDWSYQLLGSAEQRLFRALGVFAGGFTLDLAVALITDDAAELWDVVDRLGTLVDRSLVAVGPEDPPRYRLLETMRMYALEQLSLADQAGEEQATRRRHASALLAQFERHVKGDAKSQTQCEAELENAREAIAWASVHDLGLAAQLTARVTVFTGFSVWRHEAASWLCALEPAMRQPAGQALPAEVQARWWTQLAYTIGMRDDPAAGAAARYAVELWQPLGQPDELLFATVVWSRNVHVPGQELDEATAALRAQAAASVLTPRQQLLVHGSLVKAEMYRGNLDGVLEGHRVEREMALKLGLQAAAEAAECNIICWLNILGRAAEGAERGLALLARLDTEGAAGAGNLPWALQCLTEALIDTGRLDEAQALMPRVVDVGRRFGMPVLIRAYSLLAAWQQRFETAALLVGSIRFSATVMIGYVPNSADENRLARAHALVVAALGEPRTEMLMQQGGGLGEKAIGALLIGERG